MNQVKRTPTSAHTVVKLSTIWMLSTSAVLSGVGVGSASAHPAEQHSQITISQQEAVRFAHQWVESAVSHQLERTEDGPDSWLFTFAPLDKADKRQKPIALRIGKTGELLEYRSDGPVDVPVKEEGIPYALAEFKAVKLVKTLFPERLGEIYQMEPQPYHTDTKKLLALGDYYTVTFGWLKNGKPIDATLEVFVNPRTGEAEYASSSHNANPPVNNQAGKGIVDPALARKVELEKKRFLLTYTEPRFAPENDQVMLVYRLIGERGAVDTYTGQWVSYEEIWRNTVKDAAQKSGDGN
ncbi:hypothetical protein ACFSO0_12020 [Brevibacillus sp. GCM10020057]|uniref:hypothetical protein n=1 Tax=Brevibacillus sp. GCM10020057 TaxID=3317327 RepID=UPI00363472F8